MDWKIPALFGVAVIFARFSRPIPMLLAGLVLLGAMIALAWWKLRQ